MDVTFRPKGKRLGAQGVENRGEAVSSLSDAGPRPLQYDPLPTPSSIRLLEILPNAGPEIECSLVTVDLNDEPVFDALSYTWGNPVTVYEKPDENSLLGNIKELLRESEARTREENQKDSVNLEWDSFNYRRKHPFTPFEKVEWNAERTQGIRCNGDIIMVTQNLFDALKLLCYTVTGDDKVPPTYFADVAGAPRAAYIWIDAICINQADVLERNAQVRIMDRIFGAARTVIGWLGPEQTQSRLAANVIGYLFNRFVDEKSRKKIDWSTLYFVKELDEVEWMAVFALLQRLWFRRAWIVQEAVLARSLVMFCGGVMLHWNAFEIVLGILAKHRVNDKITELGTKLMGGGPLVKLAKKQLEAGAKIFGFAPKQDWDGKLCVDPRASYAFVEGVARVRQQIGMDVMYLICNKDSSTGQFLHIFRPKGEKALPSGHRPLPPGVHPYMAPANKPQPLRLEHLLHLFRSCVATNPKDKIFSLIGILNRASPAYTESLNISVDYNRSEQDVYLASTKAILTSCFSLDILSQVQDPALTRVENLPSWVPDYSVDTKTETFGQPGNNTFAAAGINPQLSPVIDDITSSLNCKGRRVGIVVAVAQMHGCYFLRTANVVSGLPQWYRKSHEKMAVFASGDLSPVDIAATVCLPIYAKDTGVSSASHARRRHSMTRVEAYWRTLVADRYEGEHPAPLRCGFGFSEWVVSELNQSLNGLELIRKSTQMAASQSGVQSAEEKVLKKMKCWAELDSLEVGKFLTLEELSSSKRLLQDTAQHNSGGEYEINLDDGGMRFLPDTKYMTADTKESPQFRDSTACDAATAFAIRLAEVKQGHRMFRTENNYLGMGPVSCQEKDEIWILQGAAVPFVLRQEAEGRRRVIGECYVQGIMHGEALEGEDATLVDVVLV